MLEQILKRPEGAASIPLVENGLGGFPIVRPR
jgi:hypothetical protein